MNMFSVFPSFYVFNLLSIYDDYYFILQGLTEHHFPVTWAPCIKTAIIIIIIVIR